MMKKHRLISILALLLAMQFLLMPMQAMAQMCIRDREIPLSDAFQIGPYDVTIADGPDGVAQRIITFRETAQSNLVAGMFLLDNKSIVTDFIASSADYADAFQEADTQAPAFAPGAGESLLAWLGGGDAAGLQDSIANGTMCMSDENIAQAFGFSFLDEATITWEAATKPLFTSG